MPDYQLLIGDCLDTLKTLPEQSVHTCVTSPPYFWQRDYGHDDQLGHEDTPDEFVSALVRVFREVRRVLRDDGTVWLNLGDSYGKKGGLNGVPWRVAFALQEDGWCLRQDIIWHKPNPMPESTKNRCTKAHEYIFLLSKGPKYHYDHEAVKEPAVKKPQRMQADPERVKKKSTGPHARGREGFNHQYADSERVWAADGKRNRRDVWSVPSRPYKGAHFATFPPDLILPCILAGCPEGGTVLDPFGGSGTTAGVALAHGRNAILGELSPEYGALVPERIDWIMDYYGARQPELEEVST